MTDQDKHLETLLWWARTATGDSNLQLNDLQNQELHARLVQDVKTTSKSESLVTLFWDSCTNERKKLLQEWVSRVTGIDALNKTSVTELANSLNFDMPSWLETGDEFDFYVYLSVMYEKAKTNATTTKEFNEFFGECALSRKNVDYQLGKRMQVETAVLIAHNIKVLKRRHYRRSESLLLEVIELLGQFAEFEELTTTFEKSVVWNDTVPNTDISANTDIVEAEEEIACEECDFPLAISDAIRAALFCENYSIADKQKLLEEHFELDLLHKRISLLLKLHNLPPFIESLEVSTSKVSRFITLLENSESSVFAKCEEFISRQVTLIKGALEETLKKFDNKVTLLMKIIVDTDEKDTTKLRTIRTTFITDLKRSHIQSVQLMHNLEVIHTSLGREFDKRAYLMKINKNRRTISFMTETIDTLIENTISAQNEYQQLQNIIGISTDKSLSQCQQLCAIYDSIGYKLDKIRVLFDHFDTNHKGYLTKSEFKKAFIKAYPDAIKLSGEDEIDTIFETNYETVGKVRRGMEFKQFETIVKLGLIEKETTLINRKSQKVEAEVLVGVTDDLLDSWKVNPLFRRHLRNLVGDSDYDSFFKDISSATDVSEGVSDVEDDEISTLLSAVQALEPFKVTDL